MGGGDRVRTDEVHDEDTCREQRRTRYGIPAVMDREAALAIVGRTGQVDPADVVAMLYRDREQAAAYAWANRVHYGLTTWHNSAWDRHGHGEPLVGVIDLRPAIERLEAASHADR